METLMLYGDRFWISPYVFSCFVGLREKGLPFRVETLGLDRKDQRTPEYRQRSLTARVPTLVHGEFALSESSAIHEYLDEAFPPPEHPALLPRGLRERARARQLLHWIRSDLPALREERATTTMFYQRASAPLSRAGQADADKLTEVAGAVIPARGGPLFGAWSIADADLAFMLHRLLLNGHEVPAPVRAFAEAEWQRPSIQEYVGRERPPYVAY
jgi:glutathione S-transferase